MDRKAALALCHVADIRILNKGATSHHIGQYGISISILFEWLGFFAPIYFSGDLSHLQLSSLQIVVLKEAKYHL